MEPSSYIHVQFNCDFIGKANAGALTEALFADYSGPARLGVFLGSIRKWWRLLAIAMMREGD